MTQIRAPLPEHIRFLSAYDPSITDLTLATRALVLSEAPEAAELIYDAYNAVASGYSFTGRPSDAFIHIAAYAGWVNLGFNHGSLLPDPQKLLQGSGKWVRHIRIADVRDLKKPAVRQFVKAAIALAERPEAPKTKPDAESVVRAVYPKRRRPKPKTQD
jgi:hypothetical protein